MVRFALLILLLVPGAAVAQTGVLVVAHGASAEWNGRVRETVAQVRWDGPVHVAFLMGAEAESAGWDSGIKSLVDQGAARIVVVPLMVSSHGSHYRQILHYAGQLAELPAELASHDHAMGAAPPVPMSVTPALDDAPELGEALTARWKALPDRDRQRPVLFIAHGPNDSLEAELWTKDIGQATTGLRQTVSADVHIALLRDDAGSVIRARAISEMRDSVLAMAGRARDSVVAIPVMISSGSLQKVKIPADLAGLPISFRPEPLTPLPVVARWIERVATASARTFETAVTR